jgi:hypothetical protein
MTRPSKQPQPWISSWLRTRIASSFNNTQPIAVLVEPIGSEGGFDIDGDHDDILGRQNKEMEGRISLFSSVFIQSICFAPRLSMF